MDFRVVLSRVVLCCVVLFTLPRYLRSLVSIDQKYNTTYYLPLVTWSFPAKLSTSIPLPFPLEPTAPTQNPQPPHRIIFTMIAILDFVPDAPTPRTCR